MMRNKRTPVQRHNAHSKRLYNGKKIIKYIFLLFLFLLIVYQCLVVLGEFDDSIPVFACLIIKLAAGIQIVALAFFGLHIAHYEIKKPVLMVERQPHTDYKAYYEFAADFIAPPERNKK